MRKLFLSCVPLMLLLATPTATTHEAIRLRFDVSRNGVLVGQPELSLSSSDAGTLRIDGVGTIRVRASSRDNDTLSVLLDIDSGGRHLSPRMVIDATHSASAAWSSTDGANTFRLTFVWVRSSTSQIAAQACAPEAQAVQLARRINIVERQAFAKTAHMHGSSSCGART